MEDFKGIKYKEGNYESLVITLGSGLGKNWWCILFPPLCLLDEEKENINYKFYVQELINKFNKKVEETVKAKTDELMSV